MGDSKVGGVANAKKHEFKVDANNIDFTIKKADNKVLASLQSKATGEVKTKEGKAITALNGAFGFKDEDNKLHTKPTLKVCELHGEGATQHVDMTFEIAAAGDGSHEKLTMNCYGEGHGPPPQKKCHDLKDQEFKECEVTGIKGKAKLSAKEGKWQVAEAPSFTHNEGENPIPLYSKSGGSGAPPQGDNPNKDKDGTLLTLYLNEEELKIKAKEDVSTADICTKDANGTHSIDHNFTLYKEAKDGKAGEEVKITFKCAANKKGGNGGGDKKDNDNNTCCIVCIVVGSVVLIGGIAAYFLLANKGDDAGDEEEEDEDEEGEGDEE